MELCGVSSLPFAVGVYLPISTSVPIFVGGMLRWVIDRKRKGKGDEEFSAGTLLASGYIAGGAIAGLPAAVVIMQSLEDKFDLGARLGASSPGIGAFCQGNLSGIVAFSLISIALYRTATKGESAIVSPAGDA